MPEISSLTRPKPTPGSIGAGEDTVSFVFDANKVTPAWMDAMLARLNSSDIMAMANALGAVIMQWDVTSDGEEYPPTGQNIGALSFEAITSLYTEVCEAAAPTSEEGNASQASSVAPASETSEPVSPSSQNGSDTSQLPTPSVSQPVT